VSTPRKRYGYSPPKPDGAIAAINALVADARRELEADPRKAYEFNKMIRENQLQAARAWHFSHCLGPREGMDVPPNATDWHGDPAVAHEPGVEQASYGSHPTCSCGFRAPLSSATEESALRRAQVHVQVSTPRPDARYVLTANDDGPKPDGIVVRLYCRECRGPSLLSVNGAPDEYQQELVAAARDHDRDHHGGEQ
jgi:hypothetical protein